MERLQRGDGGGMDEQRGCQNPLPNSVSNRNRGVLTAFVRQALPDSGRLQLRIRPGKMKLEMPRARPMLAPMGASSYSDIKDSLRHLYFGNLRP